MSGLKLSVVLPATLYVSVLLVEVLVQQNRDLVLRAALVLINIQ